MKTIISFFLLVVLISGCSKTQQSQLPPITTTGQNVMAFKVNGQIEVISGAYFLGMGFFPSFGVTYYGPDVYTKIASIYGINYDRNISLAMYFLYDNNLGNYTVNTVYYTNSTSANNKIYISDTSKKGSVNIINNKITHNADSSYTQIISGTMSLNIIDSNQKTYSITDGRFDISIVWY